RQLQHLTPERFARDAEGVADLLRLLGPLTAEEVALRCAVPDIGGWLEGLLTAKRAVMVSYAGQSWWAAVEDIGRLRDGVGVAVPVGVPMAFLEPIVDPLGELLSRYARTRGPFTTFDAAARFGLGLRVAGDVLGRLAVDGKLMRGEFMDVPTGSAGVDQWCDTEVLRILRRRSLAALRAQIEPVSTAALGRFLPAWQLLGSETVSGVDGLAAVIDQLAGVPLPASAVEPLIFGQRIRDYHPGMLDELLASGEVLWSGAGALSAADGWVAFHPADTAALSLTPPAELELTEVHHAVLATLGGGGAYFFRQITVDGASTESLKEALWQLIWSGHVGGDTFAPVRALLAGTRGAGARRPAAPSHRHRRAPRLSRYSISSGAHRDADPTVAGRWSALPAAETDTTVRAHFQADQLLARHGVLTKGAVAAENVPGGFASMYKVLTALEEAGRCQRGYFVESLGGAQFATASTVDRLRSHADSIDDKQGALRAVALAATDPANPFGAALPWPARGADADTAHRPGRKAGALVVLVDGGLAWFVERGGRSLLSFVSDPETHNAAAAALAELVTHQRVPALLVERVDGVTVLENRDSMVAEALMQSGFSRTPRGLRLR
ncbi:MAG TPA: ATP-dependent helicase, partial [Mycobacterium sp.]|nr:ATP-dependent helicase [Mycobacterium sp.]